MIEQSRKLVPVVVPPLVGCIFASICLYVGIVLPELDKAYGEEGVTVTAVLSADTRTIFGSSNRPDSHYVHYVFEVPDGRTFSGSTSGYSGKKGGKVRVTYLESNPAQNRVSGSHKVKPENYGYFRIAGWMLLGLSLYSIAFSLFGGKN